MEKYVSSKHNYMNDKLKQLEIQKLLQEYNYLLLDDEYKQELIAEGKTPFLEQVHEFMATLNMSPPPPMPPAQGQEGKKKKRIELLKRVWLVWIA